VSVVLFPSYEDRLRVHNLLINYALGNYPRDMVNSSIAHIIEKYKLKRIPIFNYSVVIVKYHNQIPIISIQNAILSDTCPVCNDIANHNKYFRTEKESIVDRIDIISVICLECGAVYTTKGIGSKNIVNKSIKIKKSEVEDYD